MLTESNFCVHVDSKLNLTMMWAKSVRKLAKLKDSSRVSEYMDINQRRMLMKSFLISYMIEFSFFLFILALISHIYRVKLLLQFFVPKISLNFDYDVCEPNL